MKSEAADPVNARGIFAAVLVLAVALLVLSGFLLYQVFSERTAMLAALNTQERSVRQMEQVKAQFESLAKATADLADQGNQHAKEIIDAMKKQGITVR